MAVLVYWLLPTAWLERGRLALYDRLPMSPPREAPAGLAEANETLRNQLRLREAEIIRLRALLERAAEKPGADGAVHGGPPDRDPADDVPGAGPRDWPKLRYWPASVVRRADMGDPDTVVLNRGADDGVRPGDAVTVDMALAGVVYQTGARSCRARLTGHPELRVPARLAGPPEGAFEAIMERADAQSRARGEAPAEGAAARTAFDWWPVQWQCAVRGEGRGRARAEVYARMAEAEAGWSVETSGLSGRIPAGLLVGELSESLRERDESGTRVASLRLRVPPESLLDVVIVRSSRD